MALELASVSSMISEILIEIGLKMTIFIYEFFGISLDASTVPLYNRGKSTFIFKKDMVKFESNNVNDYLKNCPF